MKKFVAFLSVMSLATFGWAGTAKEDSADRLQKSSEVLTQIANAPDKGIPEEVLGKAKCVAIVPHLVKGGFVFGGKHGRGVATCRTADGWSAPAFISVGGGSWGLQIGVEGVDLIMLIMNDKGMQQLLSSKFQVSGEGSAAAGPVGRHASAGTDWKLDTQMLTYSRSKGRICRPDTGRRCHPAGCRFHNRRLRQGRGFQECAFGQSTNAGNGKAFCTVRSNGNKRSLCKRSRRRHKEIISSTAEKTSTQL